MPISIMFVAPSMAGGGSERVFAHLLRHIDRSRFTPSLALLHKHGPFLSEIPKDVEIIDLKAKRARYALPPLLREVRRRRPDVVFSTLGHMNLAVMLSKPLMPRGTKLIARESIVPSVEWRHDAPPFFFPFLYRKLYPLFDAVICQSRDMQQDLLQTFAIPESKTVCIHNPVDVERIERILSEHKSRRPASPQDAGPQLAAMGRLERQKGFDLLLQALALLQRERTHASESPCRLTILGEGPEEEALKRHAQELGVQECVTFAGFQAAPQPFLAAADVFVLSSRYEGFPNVVLEAMACGAPVAAFACPGGLNEIILPGENGCLAPPEDAPALAACIQTLLHTPPAREQVRRSVTSRYGLREIVTRYEAVFAGVCGG